MRFGLGWFCSASAATSGFILASQCQRKQMQHAARLFRTISHGQIGCVCVWHEARRMAQGGIGSKAWRKEARGMLHMPHMLCVIRFLCNSIAKINCILFGSLDWHRLLRLQRRLQSKWANKNTKRNTIERNPKTDFVFSLTCRNPTPASCPAARSATRIPPVYANMSKITA